MAFMNMSTTSRRHGRRTVGQSATPRERGLQTLVTPSKGLKYLLLLSVMSFTLTHGAQQQVSIEDVFGPDKAFEEVCRHIAYRNVGASESHIRVMDKLYNKMAGTGTFYNAEFMYTALKDDDVLSSGYLPDETDPHMKKLYAMAIYFYTSEAYVSHVHAGTQVRLYQCLNEKGREMVEHSGLKYGHASDIKRPKAWSGNFGVYTHYAGILTMAINHVKKHSSSKRKARRTYRGLTLPTKYTIKTVTDIINNCMQAGFNSTSTKLDVALGFAGQPGPQHHSILLIVESKQGIPIAQYSQFRNEEEILMQVQDFKFELDTIQPDHKMYPTGFKGQVFLLRDEDWSPEDAAAVEWRGFAATVLGGLVDDMCNGVKGLGGKLSKATKGLWG